MLIACQARPVLALLVMKRMAAAATTAEGLFVEAESVNSRVANGTNIGCPRRHVLDGKSSRFLAGGGYCRGGAA